MNWETPDYDPLFQVDPSLMAPVNKEEEKEYIPQPRKKVKNPEKLKPKKKVAAVKKVEPEPVIEKAEPEKKKKKKKKKEEIVEEPVSIPDPEPEPEPEPKKREPEQAPEKEEEPNPFDEVSEDEEEFFRERRPEAEKQYMTKKRNQPEEMGSLFDDKEEEEEDVKVGYYIEEQKSTKEITSKKSVDTSLLDELEDINRGFEDPSLKGTNKNSKKVEDSFDLDDDLFGDTTEQVTVGDDFSFDNYIDNEHDDDDDGLFG